MLDALVNIQSFLWPVTMLLFVGVVVTLPLAPFKRTRLPSGYAMRWFAYVFGLTVWVWGIAVTLVLWGWLGVVAGLILLGGGVVPFVMIAAAIEGDWTTVWQMAVSCAAIFGANAFAGWLLFTARAAD